jgi:hypothetical protein
MGIYVERYLSTTTGRNLRLIAEETASDPWSESSSKMKTILGEIPVIVPNGDGWRIPYLHS